MVLSAAAVAQPRYNEVILTLPCYSGVEINGSCITNPTPAQRAQAADEARRNRERLAAEQRAEQLRKDERKRKIDAEVVRLGAHRRAEAERLVDMRDRAEAARPKPKGPSAPEMVDCSRAGVKRHEHWPYLLMTTIEAEYAKIDIAKACKTAGGAKGPLMCQKKWNFAGSMMGNCAANWECYPEKKMCPGGSKVSSQ